MVFRTFPLFFALFSLVTALVHERLESLPQGWTQGKSVHRDAIIPMRIGLTQSNLDKGEDLLMEVSHPDSPRYGKPYTRDEVIELFAPSKLTTNTVQRWLQQEGVTSDRISISFNKQWLQFNIKAADAERLLKTQFSFYHHVGGSIKVACQEYHLPSHIRRHVDYITPGIRLIASHKGSLASLHRKSMQIRNFERLPEGSASCLSAVTPSCIKDLYAIPDPPSAIPGNALGMFESGSYYTQSSLDKYFSHLATNIPNGTHPVLKSIDGGVAPVPRKNMAPAVESVLDLEVSYPLIYPQEIYLFQTDDTIRFQQIIQNLENNLPIGFFNTFLDAIDGSYCNYSAFGITGDSPYDPQYPDPAKGGYRGPLMCGKYKPTNVISISYGLQESEIPYNYQRRQCNEYLKLGLQGVSLVFGSGDTGVGASKVGSNPACLGKEGEIFSPDFPANCPWVTSVGGTSLTSQGGKIIEVASSAFQSGGGFSNIYEQPKYQTKEVAEYFSVDDQSLKYYETLNGTIGSNGGVYNRIGRGYPDVAALSQGFLLYLEGSSKPAIGSGTSMAAPIFASILNRINEERLAAKKSAIGFVNPVLYANPTALTDITEGNNDYCPTAGPQRGFSCAKGWDPVTGMGSPNYAALLETFISLP